MRLEKGSNIQGAQASLELLREQRKNEGFEE
jgi:hypothetical protein